MIPNILSVAGSDPSGGAGIQGDIKTFSALGCYGMGVVTALTAQNTKAVTDIFEVPPAFVHKQIEAVFSDIRVDALKIGMVGNPGTAGALVECIQEHKPCNVVLDPVMSSGSGKPLISEAGVKALKRELIPLADIITPNIPEAEILLGYPCGGDLETCAQRLIKMGAQRVLLTGGHASGKTVIDVYADKDRMEVMEQPRIDAPNNHGTGCALSSALAAYLARGVPMEETIHAARKYVLHTIREAGRLRVGSGNGPVNHFYALS